MTDNNKIQYEIGLHLTDYFRNKCNTLLELRYQVALIIIPTIIGVWGFLGLIVTSNLIKDKYFTVYLLITAGIFFTFFLIFLWRKWVHDIFGEEITLEYMDQDFLLKYYYTLDESKKLIKNELQNLKISDVDGDFCDYLKNHGSIPEKEDFCKDFKSKQSTSGFFTIDWYSIIAITLFGCFGLISPVLLSELVFDNFDINVNSPQWIYVHIFILISTILFIWRVSILMRRSTLSKKELQKSKNPLYIKFLNYKETGKKN